MRTSGVSEVVQTYPTYIKNATSMMLKAGAKVIISSPTPNNVFSSSGTYSWGPSRFDYYAWYFSPDMVVPVERPVLSLFRGN